MNYSSCGNIAFTVKLGGRDVNGNTVRTITFYRKVDGTWVKYKTARTNESTNQCDPDTIIRVFGA